MPAPPVCHVPTGPSDIQGSECICTTAVCGAGMANAQRLGAGRAAPDRHASPIRARSVRARTSRLEAAGSTAANGHTPSRRYSWVRGGASISTGPTANITAPTSGTATVCLTVIDDTGKQDTAKVVLTTTSAAISIRRLRARTHVFPK